ncbi:hypothetical protein [Nonomuraea sp. NPDC049400]|uniref:hypothetical protein n=1 Tax=Nonomuraea sp. NPDC049400 TaxID=3364352 RepID=UPI0037ABD675
MPTKGNPRQAFRFEPDLWTLFCAAVDAADPPVDRSEVIRQFVRWYVREKGVKLPDRLSKEDIDAVRPTPPAGE